LELMDYFSLIILSFLDPKISIKEMDFGWCLQVSFYES
jgi:hypothetical protein